MSLRAFLRRVPRADPLCLQCTSCCGHDPDGSEMKCILRESLDCCNCFFHGRQVCNIRECVIATASAPPPLARQRRPTRLVRSPPVHPWYVRRVPLPLSSLPALLTHLPLFLTAAKLIAREVFDQCHLHLHGHLTLDWAIAEQTQEPGTQPSSDVCP